MTVVNRETDEIAEPGSALAVADKSSASVVTLLEQAKSWLATCVEMTGPAEIAAAKAQIVTTETYARELRLSKDIQLDAQEMVRRAEYALGKSIRKGQAEGTIRTRADGGYPAHRDVLAANNTEYSGKPSPTDFATSDELSGNGAGIYVMADAAEPEEFDAALADAKAEGNLSRANVVRKIKGQSSSGAVTRNMRAEVIRDLAEQGYSSRQMPAKVGVTEETVRQIARDFDIEIPADRSIGRTRRVDSNRIAANTVTALEGLVMGIELVDYGDLDPREASQWADSLTQSLRALNRFVKQIKETAL